MRGALRSLAPSRPLLAEPVDDVHAMWVWFRNILHNFNFPPSFNISYDYLVEFLVSLGEAAAAKSVRCLNRECNSTIFNCLGIPPLKSLLSLFSIINISYYYKYYQ